VTSGDPEITMNNIYISQSDRFFHIAVGLHHNNNMADDMAREFTNHVGNTETQAMASMIKSVINKFN
jgi:hypothetical protein